jgi:hypothetical protein
MIYGNIKSGFNPKTKIPVMKISHHFSPQEKAVIHYLWIMMNDKSKEVLSDNYKRMGNNKFTLVL